jgi:hypothetical protein
MIETRQRPSIRERWAKKNAPKSAAKREGNSEKHLALIRQLPCCLTGRRAPSDPHHLLEGLAHERGVGRKATDRWALPVCRAKHDEIHRMGSRKEWAFFRDHGIADPLEFAAALWRVTGDLERMRKVWEAHTGRSVS